MGVRIGSLWIKLSEDGESKRTTGEISCPTGINIPAGMKVGVSIEKNTKKTADNQPDAYIEIWTQNQ